ncbi:nitroreductase family protein [Lutispora thermophila]|uniref:Nitroreductase n=1 Tax=Lutispora thermophila DSM 19022 TaxID=1122184 RepID=A0A1M6FFD5_9FIRM|nr:nitroreductase family protein [Lutispora thermophila]SHI96440.1 Nitroreductase [Lutispora thermophila DSM 19022]
MLELLKTRRSIRKYLDKSIEKEKMNLILKAALMAPTSRNRRQWEFYIVDDKERLAKLSKCRESGSQFLEDAAAAIVVGVGGDPYEVWIEDAAIAAVIMQLTAHSLGLGSCWVHVRGRQYNDSTSTEEYVKGVLNIPENIKVECIIALGYPDEQKEPHDEEKLLYNKIHR